MPCTSDREWIERRIEQTRAMIEQYEDALLKLSGDGVMSYTLDTGQTRQVVTKQNLTEIRNALASAENRLRMLQNDLNCGGAFTAKPGW